eukprot:Nk52_evm3s221 gene=Nk52_evmTU3s221
MEIAKVKAGLRKVMASKLFLVWLLVGVYIFSRSFDRVLSRRWTTQMRNYDYMAGALIFPIGGLLASIIMLIGAWALGHVPKESRMMNQWPYILAAIFDGTNSILNSTAVSFVPGQLDQAVSQLVIPFTMLVSFFALKRRYQGMHYLGAFMVIYGICLTVQPMFTGEDMTLTGTDGKSYNVSVWFILLDILSWVPAACSNTYKEYVLKGKNISVFWFSVINVFYQTIWGLIWIPYAFIEWPEPKGTADATPSELGDMFRNGFKCFFGMGGTPDGPDQCNNVWEWFLLYIFFNCAFNVTLLKISKEVSGAFAAVVSASVFILADFLFLSESLAGTVQPMYAWTVFGMIAVAIGVIMYGSSSELDKDGNEILNMHSSSSEIDGELSPMEEDHHMYDNGHDSAFKKV